MAREVGVEVALGIWGQSPLEKVLGPHPLDRTEMPYLILEIRRNYTISKSKSNDISIEFVEIEAAF